MNCTSKLHVLLRVKNLGEIFGIILKTVLHYSILPLHFCSASVIGNNSLNQTG